MLVDILLKFFAVLVFSNLFFLNLDVPLGRVFARSLAQVKVLSDEYKKKKSITILAIVT